ncbi:MAG: hypothetical protein ABSD31_08925 [Candidatus Binataceae bacterium]|jgi:hypothetical protein
MAGGDRNIWLRVGIGLGRVVDRGADIWLDPGAVRRALLELQSVFPATHLEISLSDVVGCAPTDGNWSAFLQGTGRWSELIAELSQAIGDAFRAPVAWGVGLPDPRVVAKSIGDESERGALKAGLEIASFLRRLRESSLRFTVVQIADSDAAGIARAVAPILKNSQLYQWARVISVARMEHVPAWKGQAEAILVRAAEPLALEAAWRIGEPLAGGLGPSFWNGEWAESFQLPDRFSLYGELPSEVTPKALVEAGRSLRSRMQRDRSD